MDPVLYHAHHSLYVEDLPFWQSLAAETGSPVLELGCGTGRVIVPLAAVGHNMVGLDRDAGMLAYVRSQVPGVARPLLVQADLRQFAFGVRFPLIILPCNTLSTLSRPDREALYRCVSGHLAQDGWFAASLPNPALLADLPSVGEPVVEESFPHPEDQAPVQVTSAWERDETQVSITWAYDHLQVDGSVERTDAIQTYEIIPVSSLVAELIEAGFRVGETYGDYDQSPYELGSPYWIFIAHLADEI